MPIHDQTYQRYRGTREPAGLRWLVIARHGIVALIRRRRFLLLLLASWVPFVVYAARMYVVANFPQVRFFETTPATFRDFLGTQGFWVFFITIYAGSSLVAADLRANALQIYLSKPITRADYVAGKIAIVATFLALVTLVPGWLLILLNLAFSGDVAFFVHTLWLFPAVGLYSIVEIATASFAIVALSSLSKSSRYVAVLFAGAVFFTDAVFQVLYGITGRSATAWVSFRANLRQLGDAIFRLPPHYELPWGVSLIVVMALVAGSIAILERRVRGVEVVT